MTPPIESTATQTIATIAFGAIATLISAVTIWQGRRAWRRLYGQESERDAESDLESRDCHLPPPVEHLTKTLTNPHLENSIELEAHPSSHIFELQATPFPEDPVRVAAASALSEEARLLDPLTASASSTAPTTSMITPV